MAIHRLTASRPFLPVVLRSSGAEFDAVALIDTGASMTAIHPDLVGRLGAVQIGVELVGRVGASPRWEPTYYFTIRLGPGSPEFGLEAVAAVPASPCEVLIGRDLLGRWVLSWDGPDDRLLISY